MVMTDPIADMFTRLRNGALAGQKEVVVGHSKFAEEIAKILKKEGYLSEVLKFKEKGSSRQFLSLKDPKVSHIRRLSTPGKRWYVSTDKIENPATGIRIISTSQGVLTHQDARKRKLGGELVGEIW